MDEDAALAVANTQRFADRYQLLAPLGTGGMGRVYRGHDDVLDRDVAIKILETIASETDALGQAAVREARAAARLDHPGIAKIFDAGLHRDQPFIVMELVSGQTLGALLAEQGPLATPRAVDVALQVADALEYAHQRGLIHCDVKPQNIILTPEGVPKLVDFGIARAMAATRTRDAELIHGSALYVAPEQVQGDRLDGRVDIYALGAVLYEMLTGRPPFQGQNLAAVVAQRLVLDPPSPRSLNPNVSTGLEQIVLTALARDPARRYNQAGELRDALRQVNRGDRATAQARTMPIGQTAVEGRPAVQPGRGPLPRWRSGRSQAPGRALMVVVAILLIGVAIAALLLSRATDSGSGTAPPVETSPAPTAETSPAPTAETSPVLPASPPTPRAADTPAPAPASAPAPAPTVTTPSENPGSHGPEPRSKPGPEPKSKPGPKPEPKGKGRS